MPIHPKTKQRVSWKEFFHQWKEGMEKVTPLQQASITQWGYLITAFGMIWGIIFSIKISYYFMIAVLSGGIIVLSMQFLGNWQRKQLLLKHEYLVKLAEQEVKND